MEITLDSLINIAGILLGSGGGAFFTWRWMRRKAKAEAQTEEVNMAKEVQDTYQQMLKDREEEVQYKNGIIKEMRERQDKTDALVRDLQMQVARNGRKVEMMAPFQCYVHGCKKRILVPGNDCDQPAPRDIEPYNDGPNA